MNLKPSKKILSSTMKTRKKKGVINSKQIIIDIPEEDVKDSIEFNKNSPKHWNHSKIGKSLSRTKTGSTSGLGKKVFSPSPRPKTFLFPPEPKAKPSKLLRPKPQSFKSFKPKTPVAKKPKPKLIKRPKTSISPQNAGKPETGASPISSFVTQVQKPQVKQEQIYNEHLFQTFQALKIVKNLPPVDIVQLKSKRIEVPRRPGYEKKKTVVFDLDETLVHCCENPDETGADVFLPITFPNGEVIQAGINIRPYVLDCLKAVSKDFEVFVFTASHQCYANIVLDYIDPTGELIHHRFFRENCINMNGIYIKDLRIFSNRRLSDIIIVDNAAYSFGYQLDNGIPIITWHDDREDKEMVNLIDYLKSLVDVEDVREINFETFHLRTFYDDYMHEFLLNSDKIFS